MPSGPRKRKAQRRKKEEREKELEKEKEKDKEQVKEKLNSPTTSSSSQDFNHSKKDIHYNEESSKDDTGSSSSSSSSSCSSSGSEEDGEKKKKGAADGGEDEAAVGEVKVAEEIETAIAIAIEKRVVPPAGDGAEAVPDEGADKPFDVLIERDDMLSDEGAERAVLSDPSDCPAGESIREEEELCCRESEETEVNTQVLTKAAPAPLLEHRTAWWNCCGMLDVFAGSKND